MKKILGIDLGTTTSAAAIYINNKAEIICNINGEKLIDSAVSVDNYGDIYVGKEAKNDFVNGIVEIKRRMGTSFIAKSRNKELTPEEVSAEILKYIKEYSEDYLGEKIDEAIITVPANFDSFQKMATIKAAELAGLKVERIINEPTAAALAYGFDKMENEEKILVYDFGGGTFDVSILDFDSGIMDVIGGAGDNNLGGKDIDETIMRYIANKHNISYKDDPEKRNIFKNIAEQAKMDLSLKDKAEIIVPELGLSTILTREIFEDLIKDIVEKTFECINNALKEANITEKDIKVILPVGGTCKIPFIKNKLTDKFGDKVFYLGDIQEIVALGASIQGAIKSGEISSETGIILTDICNHDLGISCIGTHQGMNMPGVFSSILKKHTPLPAENFDIYSTSIDNQESAKIEVFEGIAPLVIENIFIGEIEIKNLPKLPAGEVTVKVEFKYDLNGILKVKTIVENTGEEVNCEFEVQKNNKKENSEKKLSYKSSIYYSDYKTIIDIAEKKLNTASLDNKNKIKILLEQIKEELLNENKEKLSQLDDNLTDILFEV